MGRRRKQDDEGVKKYMREGGKEGRKRGSCRSHFFVEETVIKHALSQITAVSSPAHFSLTDSWVPPTVLHSL